MKEKTKKIVFISSVATIGAIGGYIQLVSVAFSVIVSSYINIPSRNDVGENKYLYIAMKTREDYVSLSVREEVKFNSEKEVLQGYLYEVENPHGIVISAHGINGKADNDSAQYQSYFVEQGWDVFSFDMTACGKSTGDGQESLHESKKCVKNAVKFVQNYEKTKNLPICIVGHSWGAYGAITALDEVDGVKAVAAYSAYDSPVEMLYSMGEQYMGKVAALTMPAMRLADITINGKEDFVKASDVIKKHPDVNYVIIHGDSDNYIPIDTISTYTKVDKCNCLNIKAIKLEGRTHISPWKTKESVKYVDEEVLSKRLDPLYKKYGNKIPQVELDKFLSEIDKDKASELDLETLNIINQTFLNSVK